jgi:hypothetical protein
MGPQILPQQYESVMQAPGMKLRQVFRRFAEFSPEYISTRSAAKKLLIQVAKIFSALDRRHLPNPAESRWSASGCIVEKALGRPGQISLRCPPFRLRVADEGISTARPK